jgi:trans-aconitate methyltransferase
MRDIAVPLLIPVHGLIIEIGCSDGNFAERLFRRGIKEYLGVDINKKKINQAKKRLKMFEFLCLDIYKNLDKLKGAEAIASFQVLEHIGIIGGNEDCEVLEAIDSGVNVVFSVPNSPYRTEHKRWFEIDGWKKRYAPFIDFNYEMVIQNPNKPNKRSFLFRGYRK